MRTGLARAFGWIGKAIAFPIIVLLVAVALWLPWLAMTVLPLPGHIRARWTWALRRGFWNGLATMKFRGNKPVAIPIPNRMSWWRWILVALFGKRLSKINYVPFQQLFPDIPISNIRVAGHEPADEWHAAMKFVTWVQVRLYTLFPAMQPGLPGINPDPSEALAQAYSNRHRQLFAPPILPLEFQGSTDLGSLAVRGPYACYLKKYEVGPDRGKDKEAWDLPELRQDRDDLYEWDLRELGPYEHHAGLYNLGVRVLFRVDKPTRTVKPLRIRSELGLAKPGDSSWEFAKRLALCAATNHLSLVRHFNGVHLASAAHLAIATRNCLFPDHFLCRLLWPYMFRTQQSNRAVTIAQMARGGDFDSIFSLTHRGMCDLFSATHSRYRFIVNHPEEDARHRGILDAGFDTPTQDDLRRLLDLMHRHASEYVRMYYKSNAEIQGDEPVLKWLDELNHPDTGIPNGLQIDRSNRVTRGNVTMDSLSRLIACFMYLVTVQHEIVGSFLWNYQLWAHKQPPRLYRNGTPLPLDVYQRLVNANFNLNVLRTQLKNDFSYLLLPDGNRVQAAAALRQFQANLLDLEAEWRREPWSVWRVYPSLLEVNINA